MALASMIVPSTLKVDRVIAGGGVCTGDRRAQRASAAVVEVGDDQRDSGHRLRSDCRLIRAHIDCVALDARIPRQIGDHAGGDEGVTARIGGDARVLQSQVVIQRRITAQVVRIRPVDAVQPVLDQRSTGVNGAASAKAVADADTVGDEPVALAAYSVSWIAVRYSSV